MELKIDTKAQEAFSYKNMALPFAHKALNMQLNDASYNRK
jgi:hypothetical protein